jgi:hypothetical protein
MLQCIEGVLLSGALTGLVMGCILYPLSAISIVFFRAQQRTIDKSHCQRPGAPSTHRRSGYPLSGCVAAEPDSVSPDIGSAKRTMKKGRSDEGKVVVSSSTKTDPMKERPMKLIKYIGMDVHKAMTVIAVLDSAGKVLAEAIIETKGSTILDFIKSQRGTLHVVFEEGT